MSEDWAAAHELGKENKRHELRKLDREVTLVVFGRASEFEDPRLTAERWWLRYADGPRETVPYYSSDMTEAWKVLEKHSHFAPAVFKCGGSTLWLGEKARPVGGEWGCRLDLTEDGKEEYVIGYGDGAAEAIARAALEAAAARRTR